MKNITTHLWYDKEAVEAAEFYASVFREAKITGNTAIHDTPSGSVDIVDLDIAGHAFTLINAGPLFKFNPSISFLAACDSAAEVDRLGAALGSGGEALMPLDRYPFAERYGWIEDRYGLSWQLYFNSASPVRQRITPTLMFSGDRRGQAEAAMQFYVEIFRDKGSSEVGGIARYGADNAGCEGMVMHGAFTLAGQEFYAMDSGVENDHPFNEAISFLVRCEDQAEIDYFWEKLSAVRDAEQCGWLKDRFGLSWQIVPAAMTEMMKKGSPEQMARVTQAFLQMKKFDLAALEKAYSARE